LGDELFRTREDNRLPVWKHSRIYHMTDASNWTSIQQYGLLSTSRLLRLAGIYGDERYYLERRQRLRARRLPNGAVIRDQLPLSPASLERCLATGLVPEDWYVELNRRVFFWLDHQRLNRQRRACGSSPQIVLTVNAHHLLSRYSGQAALTPFNTGNARRSPALRGRETFVPFDKWRESGWAWEASALQTPLRSPSHLPVELAIADAVEDVLDFVVDIRRLDAGEYFCL
jgi:Family of unknown function (DUF7002)